MASEGPSNATNPIVFFDITVGGAPLGRVKMELFKAAAPRAVENFRQMCTGEFRRAGKPTGYKNCKFHRVIPNFMCQGGDIVRGDGTGRLSIYGEKFDDEPGGLKMRHSGPGILSMANAGPNTNACQFFITTVACPHLDGKHVVFGRVLDSESMLVVRKMENVPTGANNKPKLDVLIAECGEM